MNEGFACALYCLSDVSCHRARIAEHVRRQPDLVLSSALPDVAELPGYKSQDL